ncbi:MAG TPA: hypothetical protein DD435_13710 [Cyanobacteria bacterium UBA8530]|nr:hypothetical protein [Cyanobacteria bacterium UBA8530]
MEAIGRLAGGVAHDFNNLLTVILGSCQLYNRQVGEGPGSRYVTRIQEAATLASKLTEGLLTLSRRRAARAENVRVEVALRAFEPLLRRLAGDGLDLSMELEDAETLICVDPGLLDQIVMNLVLLLSLVKEAHPSIEVVRLVAESLNNREIAERLVLSERTVGNHLSRIYEKLQVGNRTGAVILCRRHGLV